MSVLKADNLYVKLGDKQVLRDVSVALTPGQVTAIIGPNGAGKSTLLACLAGLREADRGVAYMGEQLLSDLSPRLRAQRIGFLPQIPEIAWAVHVRTLVGLGRIPFTGASGLSAEDAKAVDEAMALTDTAGLADRIVTTLSGGERARVLLARALAGDPVWLLADEPLTGLDPGHQFDAAALFRKLAQRGRGVVITLHDLHMAMRVADRIIVLAEGRVLADGPPTTALAPDVLTTAYGIRTHITQGESGAVIEIVGRSG